MKEQDFQELIKLKTENRERIIKLESVMERIEQRLDDITISIKEVLAKVEKAAAADREYYASKAELDELRESHKSLSGRLMQVVMAVVVSIVTGVLALLGLKL